MTNQRDWGGYRALIEEARQIEQEEKRNLSSACPVCGTPLDINSRKQRNCPMGHYRDNGVPSGGN